MDDINNHIRNLDEALDKERQDLSQSMRQHHSDWDNHIFTLSTAAIGFTFAFLPLSNGRYVAFAIFGVLILIISITLAATNFILADKGLELANKSIQIRMESNLKIKEIFRKLDRKLDIANQNNDIDAHNQAKLEADTDIGNALDNNGLDAVITKMRDIRLNVIKINHAKTYTFIIGIALISVFGFINIDVLK